MVKFISSFLLLAALLGSAISSVESFVPVAKAPPSASSVLGSTAAASSSMTASFENLRKAFPENPDIVGAGGWNNLETLAQTSPKDALVEFIVDGIKGGNGAVQLKTTTTNENGNANSVNEKLEALSLLLYGMGKGFASAGINGEWDLVFTKQGGKSPSFQKLIGSREKAGNTKNFFDTASSIFTGDVRFWKWGRVSSTVKYESTADSFSKSMDGKIVLRKITCTIINAFFKWWKLPGIPFPLPKKTGFLEIVYLDEDIRVTKGNRGGFFVHFRPEFSKQVLA